MVMRASGCSRVGLAHQQHVVVEEHLVALARQHAALGADREARLAWARACTTRGATSSVESSSGKCIIFAAESTVSAAAVAVVGGGGEVRAPGSRDRAGAATDAPSSSRTVRSSQKREQRERQHQRQAETGAWWSRTSFEDIRCSARSSLPCARMMNSHTSRTAPRPAGAAAT